MFGFIAPAVALATRVGPVVAKIATHPTTIKMVTQTAVIAGTSLAIGITQRGGRDLTAQRAAESIEKDRDPEAYATDPRRISGLSERVKHNATEIGQAVIEEAKSYRVILVPFGWSYHRAMFALRTRGLNRWCEKHSEFVALAEATTYPEELDPKLLKQMSRRHDRYAKACVGMGKYRKWLDYRVPTAGERFLDSELVALKALAREHEVRVDSVVAIYVKLLDEKINLESIEFTHPHSAGYSLHELVAHQFDEYETELIRHQVLYSWLIRYQNLSDRAWKSLAKGWDSRPVTEARKEEEQNA
jgi:hypothetical protein